MSPTGRTSILLPPLLAIGLIGAAVAAVAAEPGALVRRSLALDAPEKLELVGVSAEATRYRGRQALRLVGSGAPGAGAAPDRPALAILPDTEFENGTIELDVAGAPLSGAGEGARGFVGIAFRVQPEGSAFECFYLRPTNGRAEDQLRRNHAVQYISHPEFPWHRLREESPGRYESYVDLEPAVWTRVRVTVAGDRARLFVHGASQPSLIVNDLKRGKTRGALALWIGPGTEAYFSRLKVSAVESPLRAE